MLAKMRILFRSRDLLWEWTNRNISARYQQSALGWLWAVIQPAAQVAVFAFIFTLVVPVNTERTPYVMFSYVAIVPWTFLAASLTDMSNSLVDNMMLITKIYFPREILPFAAMLARLMDFAVAAGLIVVMLIVYRIPISLTGLLYLPLILAIQLVLVLGLGLASAAANVFFRDVRSLILLGLQLWFYASPIIYPASLVPDTLRSLYYINPMVGILESYRNVLLYDRLPSPYLGLSAAVALVILFLGYAFFNRVEFQFADII